MDSEKLFQKDSVFLNPVKRALAENAFFAQKTKKITF